MLLNKQHGKENDHDNDNDNDNYFLKHKNYTVIHLNVYYNRIYTGKLYIYIY